MNPQENSMMDLRKTATEDHNNLRVFDVPKTDATKEV